MTAGMPGRPVAAGCVLAATASAPLFVSGPAGPARQTPPARAALAGASAPEAVSTSAPSAAGLLAFGSALGVAGAALAGRPRETQRRSLVPRAAEAEEAKEPAATPSTPPPEEKKEEAKPAAEVEEKAPAEPEPAPAPAPEKKASGFQWSEQVGVTEPLGFWDPAGLSADKGEETFKEYRTAELKHGRVAMMAALGLVAQHFILLPGFDEEMPRGLGAPFTIQGFLGFTGIVGACYQLETEVWKQDSSKEIGDFGDPLDLTKKYSEYCKYDEEMRNKEINNGRFAMIATLAILVAENETGKDGIEQIFGI